MNDNNFSLGFVIKAQTIAPAWESSIIKFLRHNYRIQNDSPRGTCQEILNVVIEIASPCDEPIIPITYKFPEVIEEYSQWINKRSIIHNIATERMYYWKKRTESYIDQEKSICDQILRRPTTRSAIISLWSPEDVSSERICVSPITFSATLREGKLHLFILARSVDAWVGAVPELVSLARWQKRIAKKVNADVGHLYYHALNYHIYDADLPIVGVVFRDADCDD
jgi:hypothetical protein